MSYSRQICPGMNRYVRFGLVDPDPGESSLLGQFLAIVRSVRYEQNLENFPISLECRHPALCVLCVDTGYYGGNVHLVPLCPFPPTPSTYAWVCGGMSKMSVSCAEFPLNRNIVGDKVQYRTYQLISGHICIYTACQRISGQVGAYGYIDLISTEIRTYPHITSTMVLLRHMYTTVPDKGMNPDIWGFVVISSLLPLLLAVAQV